MSICVCGGIHLVICNDEWVFSELVMSHPFGNAYWDWYLPLVSSGWAILTVALPPVSVTNNLPFVTGCIQSMTSILADLIKPERSKVVLVSSPQQPPVKHWPSFTDLLQSTSNGGEVF